MLQPFVVTYPQLAILNIERLFTPEKAPLSTHICFGELLVDLPSYLSSKKAVVSGHIDSLLVRSTIPQKICDIFLRSASNPVPEELRVCASSAA